LTGFWRKRVWRIPDDVVDRIKKEVSLVDLIAAKDYDFLYLLGNALLLLILKLVWFINFVVYISKPI